MKLSELKTRLPEPDKHDYRKDIEKLKTGNPIKIVVLDDDPTGIQTVHGCKLYTKWDKATIAEALEAPEGLFYLLLNSRSVDTDEAVGRNKDALKIVIDAAKDKEYRLLFVSRSDSTLRGHFPHEPQTMKEVLKASGRPLGGPCLFCPALFEAGRYTYDNTQFVEQEGELIPASETEFAKDGVFGYSSANLVSYIEEKSKGSIKGDEVASFSLEDIRRLSPLDIRGRLKEASEKAFLIVNAVEYSDLHKLAYALMQYQLEEGIDLVVRSSSSFVPAAAGLKPRGLLSPAELFGTGEQAVSEQIRKSGPLRRGLVIVGSHVKKSSDQLDSLLATDHARGIEIGVGRIAEGKEISIEGLVEKIDAAWASGELPVFYTSREEIRIPDRAKRLRLGEEISEVLVNIVRGLTSKPDFIIAKGGISSHVILSEGLEAKSALVLGQISPGVPLVLPDIPGGKTFPYVIFPGNVGTKETLREIAELLGRDN